MPYDPISARKAAIMAKQYKAYKAAEKFVASRLITSARRVKLRKSDYGRQSETSYYRRVRVAETSLSERSMTDEEQEAFLAGLALRKEQGEIRRKIYERDSLPRDRKGMIIE
jgi:hypothetical protein